MQPNIIIYFGTAQNVHPTGGKLMKAWKQILQNTVTFDALTMYMLHAEYSVHEMYVMERLTFSIKTQSEKIQGMWSELISWRPELLELKSPFPLDC